MNTLKRASHKIESPKVGVVRCNWLIEREQNRVLFYYDSLYTHGNDTEQVRKFLDDNHICVQFVPDDRLEESNTLLAEGIQILVVPTARRFREKYFNGLLLYAQAGGVVISLFPSFEWDMPGKGARTESGWADEGDDSYPDQCYESRFKRLFQFEKMFFRKMTGKVVFRENKYAWLWRGAMPEFEYSDWGWLVTGVQGERIGDLEVRKAVRYVGEWQQTHKNVISPLVLIREFPESGGAFFNACIYLLQNGVFEEENLGQILLNIIQEYPRRYGPEHAQKAAPTPEAQPRRSIVVYQILLTAAGLIIGLVLARLFLPGDDFATITKTVLTSVLGGLAGLFVTFIQKSASDSTNKQ